ncbi:MAG: DUF3307 domain-containing protein [Thermotogae bacterium]|nr:DUF3307 domain-containing protein [Thermotogota bacterium]
MHLLSDFVFQTAWIARNKYKAGVLLLHVLLFLAIGLLLFANVLFTYSTIIWVLLLITVIHFGIDELKILMPEKVLSNPYRKSGYFIFDQILHMLSLYFGAILLSNVDISRFFMSIEFTKYVDGLIIVTYIPSFIISYFIDDVYRRNYLGFAERACIFIFGMARLWFLIPLTIFSRDAFEAVIKKCDKKYYHTFLWSALFGMGITLFWYYVIML